MTNPIKPADKPHAEEKVDYIWLSAECNEISYEAFHKILFAEHEKIANGQLTTKGREFSENFRERDGALIVEGLEIQYAEKDGKKTDDVTVVELLLCSKEGKNIVSRNIPIHFKGCIFGDPNYLAQIKINLELHKAEAHQVGFEKCYFGETSLAVMQYTDGNEREGFRDLALPRFYIKNSEFDKSYISIDAKFARPHISEQDAGTGNVHIENCIDVALVRVNTTNLTMKGGNEVGRFDYTTPESKWTESEHGKLSKQKLSEIPGIYNIYWGPYQKILPDVDNIDKYKELMIRMKKLAEERNDAWRIEIFNRELIKCDHCIIQMENPSHSIQDRIALGINKYVSNYGISWRRPLVLLLIANVLLAILSAISGCDISILHIFFETMNPLTKIDESCDPSGTSSFLSMLDAIHKLVYALCAYEIVRVGRRFTRLSY